MQNNLFKDPSKLTAMIVRVKMLSVQQPSHRSISCAICVFIVINHIVRV